MTDLPLDQMEQALDAATPGEWIVTEARSMVGSVGGCNPLDYQEWHDCSQSDGPDFHFIAETETATQYGEANAHLITLLHNNARALIAAARERDAYKAEREMFASNKRINDAMQTAIERGEIWLDSQGFWRDHTLEGSTK